MSNISLQKSVRTCRVDTGWADKMQSDRFLNSCQSLCPTWNGMDNYGRFVCQDSFKTETAGCRSAVDRIAIENYQRPQYFEYVNLDGFGVQGNMYSYDSGVRTNGLADIHKQAGNPGIDYGANIAPKCRGDAYERGQFQSQCGSPCGETGMVKASGCKCDGMPVDSGMMYTPKPVYNDGGNVVGTTRAGGMHYNNPTNGGGMSVMTVKKTTMGAPHMGRQM